MVRVTVPSGAMVRPASATRAQAGPARSRVAGTLAVDSSPRADLVPRAGEVGDGDVTVRAGRGAGALNHRGELGRTGAHWSLWTSAACW